LLVAFLASLTPLAYFLVREAARLVVRLLTDPSAFFKSVWDDPWPKLAWLLCLAGGAAVLALLWRSRGLVWAMARKMIIESFNRRVVVVLLLFFVILMPSLPFILKTEGNLKSQVQIVLNYSLTLSAVLLSLVAVFVCAASICGEIDKRHVQVTDTKPLRRWEFLVGKLVGVVIMCSALLFLMAGAVYGLVRYVARDRDWAELSEWDRLVQQEMRGRIFDEILVSRTSVKRPEPDVTEAVEKEFQQLRKEGYKDTAKEEWLRRAALTQRYQKYARTVPPMQGLYLSFEGLRPGKEGNLYVRFKLERTAYDAARIVEGEWILYGPQLTEQSATTESTPEEKEDGGLVYYGRIPGRWTCGSFHEIRVPAACIDPTGKLSLIYHNGQQNTSVRFSAEDGLEVLQSAEGFFPNYYRALLVIACQITLLAMVAILASAALSFPVASLVVGAVFIIGLLGPWLQGAALRLIPPPAEAMGWEVFTGYVALALKAVVRAVLAVAPHFARYDPLGNLASGRMITWGFVGEAAAVMCFLQGGVALALGIFIYYRRELARVIVRSL